MTATTKLREAPDGGADLTLSAGQLREAGLAPGDELAVETGPGRVALAGPGGDEGPRAEAMEALEFCLGRYDSALRRLAR
jgi:hypothetical protein